MDEERLKTWETLFRHALDIIDSARAAGHALDSWTFGGGTALMLRHRHRYSKDIDIFVPDPRWLGYLTPRLNSVAETKTTEYAEHAGFLKLYFPDGEIDFIVAAPLTERPYIEEPVLGRVVRVETAAEIVGKKIKSRGAGFKARDVFDLSLVLEREPGSLAEITGVLREGRGPILRRLTERETALREDFAQLDVLDYRPTYDDCVGRIRDFFARLT